MYLPLVFGRSLVDATYFMQTQTVALTFFGIVAGISMRFLHRYKVYFYPSVRVKPFKYLTAVPIVGPSSGTCHQIIVRNVASYQLHAN